MHGRVLARPLLPRGHGDSDPVSGWHAPAATARRRHEPRQLPPLRGATLVERSNAEPNFDTRRLKPARARPRVLAGWQPGTYNAEEGRASISCIRCPAGKLSEGLRATACADCPTGGFCGATGAASMRQTFEGCPAGFFNPTRGAFSNASCVPCGVGTASSIPGSSSPAVCVQCLPGSYAAANSTTVCPRARRSLALQTQPAPHMQ